MTRPEPILAAVALLAGLGLALIGQPDVDDRLEAQADLLAKTVAGRSIHLDPAEVNVLLHDPQVIVQLIDVRPEAEFNLFHLVDARRVSLDALRAPAERKRLSPKALKIFVANGEARAEKAWRIVTASGVRDAYVLAGGLELWLAVYRDGRTDAQPRPTSIDADLALAPFTRALGDRYAFARPALAEAKGRSYEEKAKRLSKVNKPAGGCGG